MIANLQLLHYLSETTYRRICERLDISQGESKNRMHIWYFDDRPIYRIELFDIEYQVFGHIWFMHTIMDFSRFGCSYEAFSDVLYKEYASLFGKAIMEDFSTYDALNCDYIEYTDTIAVECTDDVIERLTHGKCSPEQLDIKLWEQYRKPHGTIEFCLAKMDDQHLKVLARAHGTAMKKRIKDSSLHRATGITPSAAVNRKTEEEIINWLTQTHGISAASLSI